MEEVQQLSNEYYDKKYNEELNLLIEGVNSAIIKAASTGRKTAIVRWRCNIISDTSLELSPAMENCLNSLYDNGFMVETSKTNYWPDEEDNLKVVIKWG